MIKLFDRFKSVGPFILGASIECYNFPFEVEEDEEYGDSYILEDEGLSLVVGDDKIIQFIICRSELLIDGVNVIGLDYHVFLNHLSLEDKYEADILDFEESSSPQLVYDIDDLGLQVWTKDKLIVTIIVSQEDDQE